MSRCREIIEVETGLGIRGDINGERNMILANMYIMLIGLLLDVDTPATAVDTGGVSRTLKTSWDINYGGYYLCYGTGTAPESLLDYTLTGLTCVGPTKTYTEADREAYIIAAHTPGADYREVSIAQNLVISPTEYSRFILTRKVMNISAGREVRARIVVGRFWVRNYWRLLYGVLNDTTVTVTKINGASVTLRSSLEVTAGPVRLIYTDQPVAWSPDLYSLPGAVELPTERYTIWDRRLPMLSLIGRITPPEPKTITALGLVQSLYDTGGTTHDVLLAVYPLPTSVTLEANRAYSILWRLTVI